MAEVKIGDESFNVEIEGRDDAPVLILSNSLGTNLHMWDPQMPALLEHFRVVRYDSRGHGGSPAPEGPYSLADLGNDVLDIMDALGIETASWMGLSKGGMVGQWLLTHAPDRIERAVLANTAAHTGSPDSWNERIRVVREQGMEGIAPSVIGRWFTKEFQDKNPEAVGKILHMLNTTPAHGYAACISAIRDMDQREAIRGIAAPVLVIIGRHDPATPPEMGELIAANIPGAEKIVLDAAHLSNIEAEEAFTSAVISFLTRPVRKARVTRAPAAKTAGKKASPKKAAKKAAAKKVAKKATKKAVKKTAKKPAKKAVKSVKKAVKKPVKKGAVKKTIKKSAKKFSKPFARKTPAKKTARGRR